MAAELAATRLSQSGRAPVKNADLWRELDALATHHTIEWHWVRGHDGCDGNEKAHCLANDAAVAEQARIQQ